MSHPFRAARVPLVSLAAIAVAASLLSGCEVAEKALPGVGADDAPSSASAEAKPVVRANVKRGATDVPVDKVVRVRAETGSLRSVKVTYDGGVLPGEIRKNGKVWVASELLEPGVTYTVSTVAQGADGKARSRSRFSTQALTLDQQTYASVAPLEGETVGVGMPVIVNFDVPVTDQASFERKMSVATSPAQQGSWHWISSYEAHWRPKNYWQVGTDVTVDLDVNGVAAGEGVYGQEDRKVSFSIGDAHVYKVNAQTHQMQVYENGSLIRTLPITTGKEGFTTRSGVKVIMEKYRTKRMNSETVGINRNDPEAYDIDDVEYAMRITSSGEFIHAAPWSVGSQGNANVSHGCTGLSTDNAGWLYNMTQRGDVVEYTGTDRPMEPQNGYGDWNIPFPEYREGSAL